MEGRWQFFLLLILFLFILGYIIATIQKNDIINNWVSRRCELPVILTANLFKPEYDKRTRVQFTKDNFEFCMQSFVDSFMNEMLQPIIGALSTQSNTTNSLFNIINGVKKITATLYNEFSSYVESLFQKVYRSTYQISRIIQYLKMGVNRMSGIAMSMIYTGITIFRGILNSIQFAIKVILIICAILIALLIILWFILFPIIPIVLTTLGVVIYTVSLFSNVMSSSISADAESKKGGFCIAQWEKIAVYENNKIIEKEISSIKVGDKLGYDCGTVTAVIKMKGKDIPLYNINGIYVSGTHLIKGLNGEWVFVKNDKRAIITDKESPILYCFNTTSNEFPVIKNEFILYCRDWEEIPNDNIQYHNEWEKMIYKKLNKEELKTNHEYSVGLISKNIKVKTKDGFICINEIEIGSMIIDNNGKEQEVLGVIDGIIESDITDIVGCYMYNIYSKKWEKDVINKSNMSIIGKNIITETGEFIISIDSISEKRIRDFTEIGYKYINETYSFIESILRIKNISNK